MLVTILEIPKEQKDFYIKSSNNETPIISERFPYIIQIPADHTNINSLPIILIKYLVYYFNIKHMQFNKKLDISSVSSSCFENYQQCGFNSKSNRVSTNNNNLQTSNNINIKPELSELFYFVSTYFKYLDDLVKALIYIKENHKNSNNTNNSSNGHSSSNLLENIQKSIQIIQTGYTYLGIKKIRETIQMIMSVYKKISSN